MISNYIRELNETYTTMMRSKIDDSIGKADACPSIVDEVKDAAEWIRCHKLDGYLLGDPKIKFMPTNITVITPLGEFKVPQDIYTGDDEARREYIYRKLLSFISSNEEVERKDDNMYKKFDDVYCPDYEENVRKIHEDIEAKKLEFDAETKKRLADAEEMREREAACKKIDDWATKLSYTKMSLIKNNFSDDEAFILIKTIVENQKEDIF